MSPRLPRITASELARALKRDGWQAVRQRGSHVILKHPTKQGRVTVPMHSTQTVRLKTLEAILEQAELTIEDLNGLL
jgi:predicted RNA binding protein YcfA (HicA-like mRNA interferase family)